MKQILFPLVLLWSLWSTPLTSQDLQAPVILEGHIISEIQQTFNFDIDKDYTQSLPTGTTIEVEMPKHLQGLIRSMRAFKSQRWRITVFSEEQHYVLKSIFGLGLPDQSVPEFSTPVPLAESFPDKEGLPEHQHQRSTTASANQQAIVELTNQVRWDNGMRPPLKQVDLLHTAAQVHSEDMAFDHFFMHCNPDNNSTPGNRMSAAGYNYNSAGENIAAGNSSAQSTINQWVGSSGHYNNMVSTSYREIGVGHAYDGTSSPSDRLDNNGDCDWEYRNGPYYHYWTQNFGRRNTVYPVVINRDSVETASTSVDLYVYGVGYAASMRFSNDQMTWSAWEPYQENKSWSLAPGNGMKTVYAQISTGSNGSGTVRSASDMITLNGSCGLMTLSNMTINTNTTYTECEIVADPNVMIDAGEVIFEANTVTLGSNVEITPGTVFEVRLLTQ